MPFQTPPNNSDDDAPELLLHIAVRGRGAALVTFRGVVTLRGGHADLRKRRTLHRTTLRGTR